MHWPLTRPVPVNKTCSKEAKFSRWLVDVPMITGSSFAPNYSPQQTLETLKGMYDGIKQALGLIQKKTALLKSITGEIIQDRVK